jgi:hypothetical protein
MLIYLSDLSHNPKSEVIGLARRLFKRGFNGGVYFWLNTLNGKMYTGSSLNLPKRLANYWETTPNGTSIICSALLKYGHEPFVLIVVFLNSVNRDQVLALEQNALDTFKPAYNASPLASSPLGFKHSDEAKEKNRQDTLSRGWKGNLHPSYNTGKPIYLIEVTPSGFKLAATFPNICRCSTALAINRNTVTRRATSKRVFKYNDSSYFLSFDLPHLLGS